MVDGARHVGLSIADKNRNLKLLWRVEETEDWKMPISVGPIVNCPVLVSLMLQPVLQSLIKTVKDKEKICPGHVRGEWTLMWALIVAYPPQGLLW